MKRIVWLTLLMLVACKTQVVGLQQDPSFTKASLSQSPVLVLGVLPDKAPVQAAWVRNQGDSLTQTLRQERKRVTWVSTTEVMQKVGGQTIKQLWQAYMQSRQLDADVLSLLHQKFPQARYVLLAKVDSNQTRQYRDKYEEDETDEMGKPTEYYRVTIAQVAERNMSVSLLVYDMQSKLRAWHGSVQDGEQHANETSDTFHKNDSFGASLAAGVTSALIGNATHGFIGLSEPEKAKIPDAEPILQRIYKGFAENMPD